MKRRGSVLTLAALATSVALLALAGAPAVRASRVGRGEQLVYVHGRATSDDAVAAIAAAGMRTIARWDRVAVAVGVGLPSAISRLALDPRVRDVDRDGAVELYSDTSHIATRAEEARTSKRLLTRDRVPFDGTGVTIAVNDTGIDGTHPMFNEPGQTKIVRNLRSGCADLARCDGLMMDVDGFNDTDGHGTHLAGIAAGFPRTTENGWDVRGVATGAKLVSIGSEVFTSAFGMLNGLNWVLDHHDDPCGDGSCPPIRVVTNSWGANTADTLWADTGNKITEALVKAGVVVVFAIGNSYLIEGVSEGQVNPFARLTVPGVISVANYDDHQAGDRDFALASDSSRGLKTDPSTWPDLAAPGTWITSACVPVNPNRCPPLEGELRYASLAGTSMSAPYIAGVIALMLQANPSLSPGQVEGILEDTAYPFGTQDYVADATNPGSLSSFDRGHGLVDVTAALSAATGRKAPRFVCGPSAITDDVGDAVVLTIDGFRAYPASANEPAIDVTRASIDHDATRGVLRFTVEVDDLGSEPPGRGVGERVLFSFTYRDTEYTVAMSRAPGAGGIDESYRLQIGDNPSSRTVITDHLHGSFDPASDTVTAEVPLDALSLLDPSIPPFSAGDRLNRLAVTTAQALSPYPADQVAGPMDVARAACPFTLG